MTLLTLFGILSMVLLETCFYSSTFANNLVWQTISTHIVH